MKATEIIYNGYIDERQSIDTEETNEAADNLMGMIESLLPNSDRMQDVLYMECLHLAELSQKQGFMAGFEFALEMFGSSHTGDTKTDHKDVDRGEQETCHRRHYAYLGPDADKA